jgi:4-hydroxybenzoate polyprenyltransferase
LKTGNDEKRIRSLFSFFELIKFEHTIFALPFAYIAFWVAPGREWSDLLWITLAMVGARSAGMLINRIVDEGIDAGNPRTKSRPLQKGTVRRQNAWIVLALSVLLFLVSCLFLHPITLLLSPIAIGALFLYPYLKRWTPLAHFGVGFVLALAPLGATIAITGYLTTPAILLAVAVCLWVSGFDILYSLLDLEFDRKSGLHSLPVSVGVETALWISRLAHLNSFLVFGFFGLLQGFRLFFWIHWIFVGILFFIQHRSVSPKDLSKVNQTFFALNGGVGILLFIGVLMDVLFRKLYV